ncbi:MAG: hypothetical protein IJQ84_02465 [Paludibacteraceae bacterium]|nr:hypothetical protein [Paludibacteraceae bacterium]
MRKYLLPILLYLFINVLFVDKYTLRVTEWHYILDALYVCVACALMVGLYYWKPRPKTSKILLYSAGLAYSALLIALQYKIDPIGLQVDRWSAIHYFLDNVFQGIYPYAAQTHLGGYGSPFPVWQVLHIPFYAIGNVGLSFFAALALFLFVITRSRSAHFALLTLILLMASPAIQYEIVVRSDLFTNFMCVCALCEWLRYKSVRFTDYTLLLAIIAGLCASTRLAAVIPLALLYGYAFLQSGWKKQLLFVLTACGTFVCTFVPFLVWGGNQLLFFEYNPFVLQTRQGSPLVFAIFALIAIAWTVYKKDHLQHFHYAAGGLLTILVVLAFGYDIVRTGNGDLYSSSYDITYFNMALPFYLYTIVWGLNHESVSETLPSSLGD